MKRETVRSALVVVDVQHDFLPGGALAVADGDTILAPLADLMASSRFSVVIATQDWHPPGHISFASSHPGREAFDEIVLYGRPQTLWPDHCVQGTSGAQLHPSLPMEPVSAIVRKGTDPGVDSYSAIRNNWDSDGLRPTTGLAGYLRERGVEDVWVAGLARDFCVLWTALDAVNMGFEVSVLWDLSRSVDPGSDDRVRRALSEHGVRLMEEG